MAVTEGRKARRKAEDTAEQTEDTVRDADPRGDAGDNGENGEQGGGKDTLVSELRDAVREAAVEVLKPVARKATMSLAKMAVTQGPSLVKDKVAPKVTDTVTNAGGAGAMAKGLADKGGALTEKIPFIGGGKKEKDDEGGKAATGTGRGRRLPVQEFVDVAASVETVYDQFTQFEEFPQFMHRVEKVEQRDDNTLMWHENIWGVRRSYEAEIVEQDPCRRIEWRSKGGVEVVGVVTFHKLADNLTRVYMTIDFQPKGLLEKSASGFRLTRRAIKSDLMRFKAYVEMRDGATGEWRGRIEDAEVVEGSDEAEGREDEDVEAESEEDFDEEPEAEEPEAEADEAEEPEAEADEPEEPEAEADEDVEEEGEEDEGDTTSRRRKGRFSRARDAEDDEEFVDDDEDYEDADEEPVAEADEVEDEEDEPAPPKRKPRAKRRPRSTTKSK
jgi:uncharacterized membrane protein